MPGKKKARKQPNPLAESEKKYGEQGKAAVQKMEKKPATPPRGVAPRAYKGKSTRPGAGGTFAMTRDALENQGKSRASAEAIAASIGRKKYGARKMARWAARGRRRARKRTYAA